MKKIVTDFMHYFNNMIEKSKATVDDKQIVKDQYCNVELALIDGIHSTTNTNSSIIHFSINKAATQYIKSILVECVAEKLMTHAGINEYAFNTNFPYLDHLSADEMVKYQHIFKKKGYLYSVFGGMVEGIPDLEDYKVLLAIRDPRDILVSNYYSQAFSHPTPNKGCNKYYEFMGKRDRAKASDIDQYVLYESVKVNCIFERYYRLLIMQHPHVYVTKYEDMIADFTLWLDGLLHYCDIRISDALKVKLINAHEKIKPASEDIYKHLRKGLPGDYKEKLQEETINQLNETFSKTLELFGYSK